VTKGEFLHSASVSPPTLGPPATNAKQHTVHGGPVIELSDGIVAGFVPPAAITLLRAFFAADSTALQGGELWFGRLRNPAGRSQRGREHRDR